MTWIRTICALAGAATLYAGCGGAAAPVQAQTDAIAAARTARGVGAETTPQAAFHLALADDEIVEAQNLIRQGRMEAAERVLVRAKIDAELAIALQREADVRAHAVSTQRELENRQEQLREYPITEGR